MTADITGSNYAAEVASRGVLREALGADFARRMTLGNLPALDVVKLLLGSKSEASDALGVPGSLILGNKEDFEKRVHRYGSFDAAMMSFLPTFAKNLYQAGKWTLGEDDIRTARGNLLLDHKNIKFQHAALKAFGFTPTEISQQREKLYGIQRANRSVSELTSAYYARIAMAILDRRRASVNGDSSGVAHARKEIASIRAEISLYNKDHLRHEKIILNPDSIRERVRAMRLEPGKDLKSVSKKARRQAKRIKNVYTID